MRIYKEKINEQICSYYILYNTTILYVAYLRNKEYLAAFGFHLKKLRAENSVSQAELAYSCGMEISQISRMERGLINTSISNIYLLSTVLKIHPKELLDFEMAKKRKNNSN